MVEVHFSERIEPGVALPSGANIAHDQRLLLSIAISLKRIADSSDATRALLEAQLKASEEIARQLRGGALDKLREESPL